VYLPSTALLDNNATDPLKVTCYYTHVLVSEAGHSCTAATAAVAERPHPFIRVSPYIAY